MNTEVSVLVLKCKYATAHQKQPRLTSQLGLAPIESLRLLEALLRLEPGISFTLQNLLFLRTNSIDSNFKHHQKYTTHSVAARMCPNGLQSPETPKTPSVFPRTIPEQFQAATRKMRGEIRAMCRLWDTTGRRQGTEAPFWGKGIKRTTPSVV